MDENAKTNEFKEMAKAALGELSNDEIEKLKKFIETSGDISEHHGNCEELSDEQLESVGGGLMTEQSEKQTDNLIGDVTMECVGSVPSKKAKEDFKKRTEEILARKKIK